MDREVYGIENLLKERDHIENLFREREQIFRYKTVRKSKRRSSILGDRTDSRSETEHICKEYNHR